MQKMNLTTCDPPVTLSVYFANGQKKVFPDVRETGTDGSWMLIRQGEGLLQTLINSNNVNFIEED